MIEKQHLSIHEDLIYITATFNQVYGYYFSKILGNCANRRYVNVLVRLCVDESETNIKF